MKGCQTLRKNLSYKGVMKVDRWYTLKKRPQGMLLCNWMLYTLNSPTLYHKVKEMTNVNQKASFQRVLCISLSVMMVAPRPAIR